MDYAILTPGQLSQHLKSLRRARGLTQAGVGRLLGVGQVRIANIEQDPGSVSLDQFMRLVAALDGRLVLRAEVPAAATRDAQRVDGEPVPPAAARKQHRKAPADAKSALSRTRPPKGSW